MNITPRQMEILGSMLNSRVTNYVWPGMESNLVGGGDYGIVRLFENTREQHVDIVPHSHRYHFLCLVLRGQVTNKIWYEQKEGDGDKYSLQTLVYNDKIGDHTVHPSGLVSTWGYSSAVYDVGDTYSMNFEKIHSIKFSRDAMVLFFQGPQISKKSQILQPCVRSEVIPTYKVEDWMFQNVEDWRL